MPLNEIQQELLRVQANYKALQQKAHKDYKAVVVSGFSQSIEPVRSFLKLTPETKNGICQALVDSWIIAHANEGSLWNDLYTNVNGIPSLKIDRMKALLAQFAVGLGTGEKSMGPYQKLNTEVTLMRNGVIPRMNLSDGHRMYDDGYNTSGGQLVADGQLADKILGTLPMHKSHGLGVGSYAMISIKSAKGGHVMVAYLGGTGRSKDPNAPFSDVAFFDPNVGEYWFQDASEFARFFRYLVGRIYSTYGGYQIRSFARKVD